MTSRERVKQALNHKVHDGTPVLVPGGFNTKPEPNGDIMLYPEGDKSAAPSGRMPDQIRQEVKERMEMFGRGGGFVFNTVHNVQAGIPVENLTALYEAVGEFRFTRQPA